MAKHSLILFTLCLLACKPSVLVIQGMTMGTSYQVSISDKLTPGKLSLLRDAIGDRLQQINARMSTYDKKSEISRFGDANAHSWFAVSAETVMVVNEAQRISALSSGALDITVAALVNLWGFGPAQRAEKPPAAAEIAKARRSLGYRRLQVRENPPALKKSSREVTVDLSAISKGYAVDEVAQVLISKSIGNFLVEIGGELRAAGKRPDGEAWKVGVESPENKPVELARVIKLSNIAMATSGDYRNFFEEEDRRYSHTIDPTTGYPTRHNLASVTVLHKKCMTADALATAFMVMGARRALELATRERIAAFFITRDGETFTEKTSPTFPGDI